MFMVVNFGLTNAYLERLADRSIPAWASNPVIGGENIGERHASTGR